ncbi:cation:proton antiporter [Myxococcota bacterium]|nr:cation:proton antiporter [Myxococcota bacterium]MBU1412388.1 cation:proton antiporter [Myxococcota bacterium]
MSDGFLAAGLLLAAALFLGRLFARFHLPQVTGYLMAGLVLGPSLATLLHLTPLISKGQLQSLDFLTSLGLSLIMFSVGSHFSLTSLRKYGHRIFIASLVEAGMTFLLVFSSAALLGAGVLPALFLGIMALNTAPGATQMVMRELRSEGELSELALILIGMNNLLGIILFVIAYQFLLGSGTSAADSIAWQIGGPAAAGLACGLVVSFWEQRLTRELERQIMLTALLMLLVWASVILRFNLLFSALVTGMTVINFSPHEKRIFNDIHRIDYPIYVLFFALAGTHLRLEALPSMGVVGLGYVGMRAIGKFFGNRIGATAGRFSRTIRQNLGGAMLCQGAVAIGLAAIVANTWRDPRGLEVQNVILAAVLVFEVAGPIMARLTLVRAGEVTVVSLLTSRAPVGIFEGIHDLLNHFAATAGLSIQGKLAKAGDMPISMVMRRHVESIPEDLSFDALLRAMGHSRYDRLPVVDRHHHLVGIIHYAEISDVLFAEELRQIVVAGDIAVPPIADLAEDDPLESAMSVFRANPNLSYLFIVDSKDRNRLAGVLRHNDALSAHGDL